MKGRSSRTGEVELTDNEARAAKPLGARYWLYRVYVDPDRESHFEVATLSDPLNSKAVRTVTRFDLAEGSGAAWFTMVETVDDEAADDGESTPADDRAAAESGSTTAVSGKRDSETLSGQATLGAE